MSLIAPIRTESGDGKANIHEAINVPWYKPFSFDEQENEENVSELFTPINENSTSE